MKTPGPSRRHLSTAQLDELRAAFARAHFADLSEHCCDCYDMTGMPGTVITFVERGRSKTIRAYQGYLAVPPSVKILETDVDRIVGIESLIGRLQERSDRPR